MNLVRGKVKSKQYKVFSRLSENKKKFRTVFGAVKLSVDGFGCEKSVDGLPSTLLITDFVYAFISVIVQLRGILISR
jgi:hypothetical protein